MEKIMCLNLCWNVLRSVIEKTERFGGVRSNQFIGCTLVVEQLCYINCLNACATFRNQKLCCGTVFLHENDERRTSSGLQFKTWHQKGMLSV